MKCPFCGTFENRVVDSRLTNGGNVTRRRRVCEKCGRRFTTYERIEELLPAVIKRDGRRESFDRQKIVHGIRAACNKRPVSLDQIDAIADAIERSVQESDLREVSFQAIGEQVMHALEQIDQVAYVRFASVYQQFDDPEDFARELAKLVKPSPKG